MTMKRLIWLLAGIFVAPPLAAQERPYFVTYDHFLEERGNLEVAVNSTFGTQRAGGNFTAYWTEFEEGGAGWSETVPRVRAGADSLEQFSTLERLGEHSRGEKHHQRAVGVRLCVGRQPAAGLEGIAAALRALPREFHRRPRNVWRARRPP